MKKLSFFIALVLVVVYNGSMLGMVDPEFVELQRRVEEGAMLPAPSLEGRLKPVANFFDRNLERYHRYEESNPTIAKYALKGSLILAKGFVGAVSGVVTAGPAGGGSGFLLGMGTGIVQEIRGSITHGVVGESLNAIVNRGIDTLAPQIMRLDTSLDEREAKILACAAISATLSASEFKEVSKGMRRSVGAGHPRATTAGHSTAGQALHNGHNVYEHIHTIAHAAEAGLTEDAIESLMAQEHQAAPAAHPAVDPLEAEELFEQSRDALGCWLTETVQEHVRENIQTSRQVGQLERHTDQPAAAREMQDLFATAAREEINYQISRNTVADTFTGFSAIMSIAGNHKAAHQIATVGYAGIKIMDSCRMLSTGASTVSNGTSALAGFGGAGITASCICPYVGIACAVASLVSLCADDSDGLGEALGQIQQSVIQMHQSLSQQIFVIHKHMMERFDNLEGNVDSMHVHMVQGFLKVLEQSNYLRQDVRHMHVDMIQGFKAMSQGIVGLSRQVQDSTALSAYSFEHINSDLQALHAVNAKMDASLLAPVVQSCAEIEKFPSRWGSFKKMEEKEFAIHCKVLENSLQGIDPRYAYLNGHICADFSPITMNRILTSSSPESLLGYLAKYSTSQLGVPLPSTVQPAKLPNLSVFVCGLGKYLTLRQATTHIPYDLQCKELQNITRVGDHALTFIDEVQGNRALFRKLYANYKACYAKVLVLQQS